MVKWRVQLGEDESIKRNDYIFGLVVWSKNECGFIVEQLTKGKFVNTFGGNVFEYDTEFYSVNGAEFNWEELEVVGNKYENSAIYKQFLESEKMTEVKVGK